MKDKKLTWEESVLWLRNQPDKSDLVKYCFYDDPLIDAAKRYYNSSEWDAVRNLLPKTLGKALDLGAGRGISSYSLAKDGWEVTALEPDSSEVVGAGAIRSLARLENLNITISEEKGEILPFEENSFDLVYGRAVMHHADDLQRFCEQISRVLKPGGVMFISREHVIDKKEDLQKFLDSHPLHHLYGGENAYLVDEYLSAMKNAGLKVTKVLNPYQSNVNLFPSNTRGIKRRVARKYKLRFLSPFIPKLLIKFLGDRLKTPGRLYTFSGVK
ncbi:MAG: class I SAM-dependent methyltransferase [Leptospirales bacterium]